MLGWLGVALTGSDTASNVLFGSLQKITAEQAGISPILMGAANSSGGVMGKMIDAQSIVVASTATGYVGHEGAILRGVFWHSLALATLVGMLVFLQAKVRALHEHGRAVISANVRRHEPATRHPMHMTPLPSRRAFLRTAWHSRPPPSPAPRRSRPPPVTPPAVKSAYQLGCFTRPSTSMITGRHSMPLPRRASGTAGS